MDALVEAARAEIERSMQMLTHRVNASLYSGPWSLDPEAFPEPVRVVPRLRRLKGYRWYVGTVDFDTEAEARSVAETYGARVRRSRVYAVPKGTAIVRQAIDMLAERLKSVPAWDEMEARRRKAEEEWHARGLDGFAAWIPKAEGFGGEAITVPVRYFAGSS